ncbi:hypothetical protein SAMN06265174_102403 [Dietzia kunjamensis subsp. schimae]|uniref:Uncharacterized protein n=1 Tax=Dietzia kunjamensis subsp. schimae TaxID=498198 RepID=A0ABY1MZ69_9ACTN|nr:hypothetical protein [Dietzia kunjamensis]MBB1016621.1 hypothetical protein [Dietzia kunjamensis subsp. schimae]SMO57322.1 hypothetical protein SAMN06265174_102403 [Dietzia kunjamensis subsp. schimae]
MSTLTDRYIAEVVRHLPEDQRDDISSEIAATIADMVAAELDAGNDAIGTQPGGTADRASAERAVLARLGDPAELAHRYAGARQYLVGPDVYPVWARVLRWLLPVVGVIAALAGGILYVSTTAEPELGGLIGQLVSSVAAALLWAFAAWTLVVVIIERTTPEGERSPLSLTPTWDPAHLDGHRGGAESRADAVVSLVLLAVLAAVPFVPSTFLYIGHLNGGEPLVNPAIPTRWFTGYVLLIGALALVQVWRLVRPGRSPARLGIDVVVDVVFGVFLTVLVLSHDSVIHPDLVPDDGGTATTAIRWSIIATIWVIVAWDQIETLRAYRRGAANAA